MSKSADSLQERLIEGYRRQLEHYQRALRILETFAPAGDTEISDHPWAHELHDLLTSAAAVNAGMATDRAAWQQAGAAPSAELSEVLDRLAEQIRTLSCQIDKHVARLLERRQRLVPVMDEFIRQRWMLNAYGKHGQSAPTP